MKFLTDTTKKPYFLPDFTEQFERSVSLLPQETFRSVHGLLIVALLLLGLAGSLIFWVPRVAGIFISHANNFDTSSNGNQAQLELSQTILRNTKRMVGNQKAWSESIRLEYNQLFGTQQNSAFSNPGFGNDSYSDNFIESQR